MISNLLVYSIKFRWIYWTNPPYWIVSFWKEKQFASQFFYLKTKFFLPISCSTSVIKIPGDHLKFNNFLTSKLFNIHLYIVLKFLPKFHLLFLTNELFISNEKKKKKIYLIQLDQKKFISSQRLNSYQKI